MTTTKSALGLVVGVLGALLVATTAHASERLCTTGRWVIDGGPVVLGPLSIDAVGLREGVPVLDAPCRAVRWSLSRVFRETRLRALFVCTTADATEESSRFPLRLRARIADGCRHMRGAIGSRRLGVVVHFTATQPSPGCGGLAGVACPDGEFCELPAGQCDTADLEGQCVGVPETCPELYAPVCGCDGVTYGNECERRQAEVQKAHDGECGGCLSNDDCQADAYCAKPHGECAARGRCEPRPLGCPDNVDPVCGCDGTTYSNRCDAAAAGTSVAHPGRCDEPRCGGIAGIPCREGEFCELPPGECQSADLQGRCVVLGDVCPDVYAPVCGCDGTTYDNDCVRRHAGVQKAQDGVCECVPLTAPCETACDCYETLGQTFCNDCPLLCPSCGDYWQCKDGACVEACGVFPPDLPFCSEPGCATSADCAADAYCAKPLGECAARGKCEPRPLGCPDVYLPVCGCDGTTYGNRCDAAAAGVSVAREGECRDVCGGIAGIPCPDGQFCDLPAGECASADLQGRCVEVTDACPEFYSPVCGCDGKTYANDCMRQQAGAQKAHDGTCSDACVPTNKCEVFCDCYAVLGNSFCEACPLLFPN